MLFAIFLSLVFLYLLIPRGYSAELFQKERVDHSNVITEYDSSALFENFIRSIIIEFRTVEALRSRTMKCALILTLEHVRSAFVSF